MCVCAGEGGGLWCVCGDGTNLVSFPRNFTFVTILAHAGWPGLHVGVFDLAGCRLASPTSDVTLPIDFTSEPCLAGAVLAALHVGVLDLALWASRTTLQSVAAKA